MNTIRVGSRESRLAVVQSELVMYAIRALTAFYERNLTINGAESVEL